MRVVNWESEERVDVPDKQAEMWITVGEFRRLIRGLVTKDTTGIVRGFKVEAASPADSTVRVRLDPGGGGALSVAVGGENTGTVDYGQLIGDRGQEGLEGNSSYTIDFTPQIAGTYIVEMRFVYAEGVSDNRAFWNNATEVEFIAAHNTRVLPGIGFQIVSSVTGGEWLPLATVVWDGATIDSADITLDRRKLLFEGGAPWTQTTQEGSGAMADFDRGAVRPDVTTDELYTALKKLGRQIQDIKGPDESGVWSFHRRPIRPMDPGNLLNAARTKSLASMDSLEYTVGDGTTTWGDFNGSTGLQQCLSHIAASEANLPSRIRIRLKSRQTGLTPYLTGAATPIWTCATAIAITTSKHIEIIGDISKADLYGRVPVAFTHAAGIMFDFSAAPSGSLTLRNIAVHNVPTQELFRGTSSVINLYNTMLCAVSSVYVLRTHCPQLVWEDSEIYGAVQMFSNALNQDTDGFSVKRCRFGQRTCYGTSIDGHMRLWAEATFGDDKTLATWYANQGTWEACEFFYGSNTIDASSTKEGCFDMRGASSMNFFSCDFSNPADANGVLFGTAGSAGLGFASSSKLHFDACRSQTTISVSADHDVDAGYNTTKGTGWAFFGENSIGDVGTGVPEFDVDRCSMHLISWTNTIWLQLPTLDSGGIYLSGYFQDVKVDNCRFHYAKFPNITYGGTPRITCARFDLLGTGGGAINGNTKDAGPVKISDCDFARIEWAGTHPMVKHLHLSGPGRGYRVSDSTFELTNASGANNAASYTTAYSGIGIQIDGGTTGYNKIDGCFFRFFDTATDRVACIWGGDAVGNLHLDIADCYTDTCSYLLQLLRPGGAPNTARINMHGNRLLASGAPALPRMFLNASGLPSASRVNLSDNQVILPPGGNWSVVHSGDCDNAIAIGNDFGTTGQWIYGTNPPVGFLQSPNLNIHWSMPTSATSEEYRHRNAITRVVMIPLSYAGGSSGWDYVGGNLLSSSPSTDVDVPITHFLRSGSVVKRVRVAYDNNGVPGTPPGFSLMRRVVVKTAPPTSGTTDVERSDTDGTGGTTANAAQIMDTGTFTSTTAALGTQEWFVRITGSDNAALDVIQWVEVTIEDAGPQNG